MAETSIGSKLKKAEGLIDTRDINEWESNFLQSLVDKAARDKGTQNFTEKQIDVLERIYSKHFA